MQLAKNVVDFLNILHFSEHSESKDFLNVCALSLLADIYALLCTLLLVGSTLCQAENKTKGIAIYEH
jgi:hypothetical protein